MITVAEARTAILNQAKPLDPIIKVLSNSLGHVLAADIYASIDIPAFKQSSMDGYALRFEDHSYPLTIKGEMAAGTTNKVILNDREAARIFTGAPLPEGADTVVMQEKISFDDKKLIIEDKLLKLGINTRNKGSEVKAGALAIAKGSYLSPAALGFVAGIGENEVTVYPMPGVSIIMTGNELQRPGKPLSQGQVYESNSFSLNAALAQAGVSDVSVLYADDDLLKLKSILDNALEKSDIILLTGGVSVGDYDFVVKATQLCGIEQIFHKVKQKPGKPLFFGVLGEKLIFGLPGNPSSVLNCYYQFVLPAIEAISGRKVADRYTNAKLLSNYEKNAGLTHFVKAFISDGDVMPLGAQESYRMSSFAEANCMICFDEDSTAYKMGDVVKVFILPT